MRAALTLPNDIGELPRLLELATAFSRRNRLPSDEASRLLVVIDELFSNIVRHGFEAHSDQSIVVVARYGPGAIELSFEDDGAPPWTAPASRYCPPPSTPRRSLVASTTSATPAYPPG